MSGDYADIQPKRAAIDALAGPAVVEFGNAWCGHCRRAQPHVAEALAAHPGVRHMKFADALSRRLGRSFGVKLWPTLIFLKDGRETGRVVRPTDPDAIRAALGQIDAGG